MRDFQTAFRLMRQFDGASQERIASVVEGLTQGRVSRVMSGRDRLASLTLIERLADGLRIPGELLGLAARSWEGDQASGLIVDAEHAEVQRDGREYRITVRRRLRNVGSEAVTRFLIRVDVDRYPDDHRKSNEFYRAHPLTLDELGLSAHCGPEPMTWKLDHDRDAVKEVWLLFENPSRKFPIRPGATCEVVHSFTISDAKWGDWFEREVRLPTRYLTVVVKLPRSEDPAVWGTETSPTTDAAPIRGDIDVKDEEQSRVFRWSTNRPRLHTRYRLEWYREEPPQDTVSAAPTAVSGWSGPNMSTVGIVQRGSKALRGRATRFVLPADHVEVRDVIAQLYAKLDDIRRLHEFGKGMGMAAPQLGIDRAAAVVLSRAGEAITLINPRIVEESVATDTQYEGCLSFFDVRGEVPRPLHICVEHCDPQGDKHITVFSNAVARLVAHEIDHLEGLLYTDRMPSGAEPIPVSEYRGTGQAWGYPRD
ncbi:MAG TPA: peptide deformylase [Mycobacteriales bacterium]|jgi:peptide deformylase|nr:peptide deformylase [Mycobacteriales bacterium]